MKVFASLALCGALAACSSSPASTCTSSRECSSAGLVCDTGMHRCVECVGDVDCLGTDMICQASHCVARVACMSSRECPGRVCDTVDGYCVDCVSDVDCTGGDHCVSHGCVAPPPACHSDRDCSAMGLVCDVAHTNCVECVMAGDCAAGSYCAADHVCLPGAPMDGGPHPDAGPGPHDGGGPMDSGGGPVPDAGGGPLDAGVDSSGTTGPMHGAIHLTWTISDTFGPLTCADVGIAQVEMLNPVDRTFRCGDGAGDVTGLPFGFAFVSAQGNDSSHIYTASASGGGSLDLEASPCDRIIAGDCGHDVAVEFRY